MSVGSVCVCVYVNWVEKMMSLIEIDEEELFFLSLPQSISILNSMESGKETGEKRA